MSPFAPISMICLIGPIRTVACRMASTWTGRQESTPRADNSSIAATVCSKLLSADPNALIAVIATSSLPCFFSQTLNRMSGAPATKMPSTAATIFRLVRRWIGNDGLAASAGHHATRL